MVSLMLSVINAECHMYAYLLSAIMLSVVMLSVVMLSVVLLSDVAPNYGCNPFYSIVPWPELILSLAVAI